MVWVFLKEQFQSDLFGLLTLGKAGSVEIHLFVTFPHVIVDGTEQPLTTASLHNDLPFTFDCPFTHNENGK